MVGDFNGDKKCDIIGFHNAGPYISHNTGSGFDGVSIQYNYGFGINDGYASYQANPRVIGDVDVDGKDDIIGFKNDGVYVSFSNGNYQFTASQKLYDGFGVNTGWNS